MTAVLSTDPEPDSGPTRPALPVWTAPVVLAAVAVALALSVLWAGRVLVGGGPSYLDPGSSGEAYARAAYVVQLTGPDQALVLPLLGLVLVGWLLRTGAVPVAVRAVRWTAVALTALLLAAAVGLLLLVAYLRLAEAPTDGSVFLEDRLQTLGRPAAGALLLLALSAVLLRLLLAGPPPVVEPETADDTTTAEADPPDVDPPGPAAAAQEPDQQTEPEPLGPDRHAAYRRPTEPARRPVAPAAPAATQADPHAAYRRPTSQR